MEMASVFEWFAQESIRSAELAHDPRQREIWTRLAVLWGLAAAHCRHEEAGAIDEDAAVYLGGDAPRAAQGVGPPSVAAAA
jgi:hypothetical protein